MSIKRTRTTYQTSQPLRAAYAPGYNPTNTRGYYPSGGMSVRNASRMGRRAFRGNVRYGGFIGIENKFYDTSRSGVIPIPTNASGGNVDPATVNCISAPAQGDGESNRDGKQIAITSCHLYGSIYNPSQVNQTALESTPLVFVALVIDTQTNGAQLDTADVFKNTAATALTSALPMRNLQYSKRFKVVWSKTFRIGQDVATFDGTNIETGGTLTPFKIHFKPKKPMKVEFTGTTAGISNVVDNSLHVVAYSSNPNLQLSYNARVRFVG